MKLIAQELIYYMKLRATINLINVNYKPISYSLKII